MLDPEVAAADRAAFAEQDRAAAEFRRREQQAALDAAIEAVLAARQRARENGEGGESRS